MKSLETTLIYQKISPIIFSNIYMLITLDVVEIKSRNFKAFHTYKKNCGEIKTRK